MINRVFHCVAHRRRKEICAEPLSSFVAICGEVRFANSLARPGTWKESEELAQRDLRSFPEGQLSSRLSAVESRLYIINSCFEARIAAEIIKHWIDFDSMSRPVLHMHSPPKTYMV
jgi:hypothetical protein